MVAATIASERVVSLGCKAVVRLGAASVLAVALRLGLRLVVDFGTTVELRTAAAVVLLWDEGGGGFGAAAAAAADARRVLMVTECAHAVHSTTRSRLAIPGGRAGAPMDAARVQSP
jgi:hypothetical protein